MQSENEPMPTRDVAGYFKELSTGYARQTGDSTYNLAHAFLSKLPTSDLSSSSIIHDNACGVGTATQAILSLTGNEPPQRIEATDSSPGMIDQLSSRVSAENWDTVHPALIDSHHLPFPDNTFTLSITNISVSNFKDPSKCLQEIHRTLQPGGLGVVSIWKRFTVKDLIHQAQRAIKGPDVQLMEMPRAEFTRDGYLRERMVEAGFSGNVCQTVDSTIIQGEALEGLRGFMTGDFTASVRVGWTEAELAKWGGAVDEAIAEEIGRNGGILMEAWFVTARK
jgi:ubiquinone/menaquinone biosynthesis C-methylase UbiE